MEMGKIVAIIIDLIIFWDLKIHLIHYFQKGWLDYQPFEIHYNGL